MKIKKTGKNNKIISSLMLAFIASQLSACSQENSDSSSVIYETTTAVSSEVSYITESSKENTETTEDIKTEENNSEIWYDVEYTDKELKSDYGNEYTEIKADNSGFTISGSGASAEGNVLTISESGTYLLSGNISDGQIIVNSEDKKAVRLVMNGFSISCSNSAPLNVLAADKVIVTLVSESENYISDTERESTGAEDEPTSAFFSKSDVSINGEGTLVVNAKFGDGIVSKDKLKIISGNINITSADDGIIGRDMVAIKDGDIQINALGDGIKTTCNDNPEKGYVIIDGGNINIVSANDGIQSENSAAFKGGVVNIEAGGGYENGKEHSDGMMRGFRNTENQTDTESSVSMKGIKAVNTILMYDGDITINSADDAIHSNNELLINGGKIAVSSGDDGVHGADSVTVNGGELTVLYSYEGMEGRLITVNSGSIHLNSDDDGMNASSDDRNAEILITFNGGYTFVNAAGDGVDSNGNIVVNDGIILVNGPTESMNGPLDCGDNNNDITVNGGTLIAAGSSGMFEVPSTSSSQNSVATTNLNVAADTLCTLSDENGNVIVAFVTAKKSQAIVISTPEIQNGKTYTLYTGGTYTGEISSDGYATGGSISGGDESGNFTIESTVTTIGNVFGGFGGFGGGGGRPDFENNENFPSGGRGDFKPPSDGNFGDFDPSNIEKGDFKPSDGNFGDFDPSNREKGDFKSSDENVPDGWKQLS